MFFAQVSDLHIPGTWSSVARARIEAFEAALQTLAELRPEVKVVVLSGDLAEAGEDDAYRLIKDVIEQYPRFSFLPVMGNRDSRRGLRMHLLNELAYASTEENFYACKLPEATFICLDTTTQRKQSSGRLGQAQRNWLVDLLSRTSSPVFLAMHHPPFEGGVGRMDEWGLGDGNEFMALIATHPQVRLVMSGHWHRPVSQVRGGTLFSVCGSAAFTVKADLFAPDRLRSSSEMATFQLYRWEGGLLTSWLMPCKAQIVEDLLN